MDERILGVSVAEIMEYGSYGAILIATIRRDYQYYLKDKENGFSNYNKRKLYLKNLFKKDLKKVEKVLSEIVMVTGIKATGYEDGVLFFEYIEDESNTTN